MTHPFEASTMLEQSDAGKVLETSAPFTHLFIRHLSLEKHKVFVFVLFDHVRSTLQMLLTLDEYKQKSYPYLFAS